MSKLLPLWKWVASLLFPYWFLKFFFQLHMNTWANMIYLTLAFFSMLWWKILLKAFGNTSLTYHSNHSHSLACGFFQWTLPTRALYPNFAKALSASPFYVMVSCKSALFSSQLVWCRGQAYCSVIPEFKNKRNLTFAKFYFFGTEANVYVELQHS